jgi:transcriptional regulator with XRE-family HTH domain
MFEIGSSLREARERQGLELDDVVDATLIRARYLEALEQERFELLPEGFYRRSFLRRYAQFLGLNGDIFVDEYDVRYGASRPEPEREHGRPRFVTPGPTPKGRPGRLLLVIALAALVALGGLGAWLLGGSGGRAAARPTTAAAPRPHVTRPRPVATIARRPVAPAPVRRSPPVLVLTAARGVCWLEVRIGSSSGHTLFEATLQAGESARFGLARPLWIRFGAPANLDARIGKRSVTAMLPSTAGDVRAAANGLEPSG